MRLLSCTIPNGPVGADNAVTYFFPSSMMKLSLGHTRKSAAYAIAANSGAVDPFRGRANPYGSTLVQVQFRITPDHGSTMDATRDRFIRAVGHGLPQQLTFVMDDGSYRFANNAKMVSVPRDVTLASIFQIYEDWQVEWVIVDAPPLEAPVATGVLVWGMKNFDGSVYKWGQAGVKWGQTPYNIPLTSNVTTITLVNNLATADTPDMAFLFKGVYGPQTPGVGTGWISLKNLSYPDINTGQPLEVYIYDNMPTVNDTFTLDFGSKIVRKNASSVWSHLGRPLGQGSWMKFSPGTNILQFSVGGQYGTPLSGLSGHVNIKWKPKFFLT